MLNLDYGVRSNCCYAPIRFGWKIDKKSKTRTRIFICCRCETRDVDIVDRDSLDGPSINRGPTLEEFHI